MSRIKLILICWTIMSSIASAGLYEAARATVRIGSGNAVGSGIVVGANDQAYYALTNAHVADKTRVTVEFFDGGKIARQATNCETVSRDPQNDVAVVQIDKNKLNGYVPQIIPIDPAMELKPGDPLGSVGHPHGENPTAFIGSYVGTSGKSITFRPPPAQGRSGSALFDKDFTRVIGLIWGCDFESVKDRKGYGVPARLFSTALGRELTKGSVASNDYIDMTAAQICTCRDTESEIIESAWAPFQRFREMMESRGIQPPLQDFPSPPFPWRNQNWDDLNEFESTNEESSEVDNQKPFRPILPDTKETRDSPKESIDETGLKLEIGGFSLGIEKPKAPTPEPKPTPPAVEPPKPDVPPPAPPRYYEYHYYYPAPPRDYRPAPPRPHGHADASENTDVMLCQYYYYTGSCPGGNCPTTPYYEYQEVQAQPKAEIVKPKKPIPIGNEANDIKLPDPEQPDIATMVGQMLDERAARIPKAEIPVTVADPRLDDLPQIKETVFGLRGGIKSDIDSTTDGVILKFKSEIQTITDQIRAEVKGDVQAIVNDVDTRIDAKLDRIQGTIEPLLPLVDKFQNFDGVVRIDWGLPDGSTVWFWIKSILFWSILSIIVIYAGVNFYQNRKVKHE